MKQKFQVRLGFIASCGINNLYESLLVGGIGHSIVHNVPDYCRLTAEVVKETSTQANGCQEW
jgi:hypothetical protein